MTIVKEYFANHPEAKDGVMKAYYAYHAPHFRQQPQGHNFTSSCPDSKCSFCGRSRIMVRHDELPPICLLRPEMPSIEDTILIEEKSAFELSNKSQLEIPKLIEKLGLTGKTLAILHHTYGYDPATVESVVEIPADALKIYQIEMEHEKERSRLSQKKETISLCKND